MSNTNCALVIGVGGDLPNTVEDAQGLARVLADSARCAYDPARVKVLTEREASRAGILAALDQLAQTATPDGTVVVFFSGHGGQVKASIGTSYFLMAFGYDMQDLANTAISGREFADKLAAIKSQRLLLLLDCCHAQGIAEVKSGLAVTKSPIPPEASKLFAEGSGKVLLASCKADQVSFTGKPYSLFTRALIECLCGMDIAPDTGDGLVRANDLAMYASRKVAKWSRDKQLPVLDTQKADNFVVAYYAGGAKAPLPVNLPPIDEEAVAQENKPQVTNQINQSGGISLGQNNQINLTGDIVGGNKTEQHVSGGITFFGAANIGKVVAGDETVTNNLTSPLSQAAVDANNAATLKLSAEAQQLVPLLNEAFNEEELRSVCFELTLDWDNLAGTVKMSKAQSLVLACEQRGRVAELKTLMQVLRPNLREQLS